MTRTCRSCKLMRAAFTLCAILLSSVYSPAQTITVLHSFSNGADGSTPLAGVTLDRAGNLYGTTTGSTNGTFDTVYKLTHTAGGNWVLSTIYTVNHAGDPTYPTSR